MTNSPTPEPPTPRRNLSLDELIAIIVAFLTIGALIFWGLTRKDGRFAFLNQLLKEDTPVMAVKPELKEALEAKEESEAIVEESQEKATIPQKEKGEVEAEKKAVETPPQSLYVAPPAPGKKQEVAKQVSPEEEEVNPEEKAEQAEKTRFADVPTDYWAYPFIEKVAAENIIKGAEDGNFYPDKPVTREEFAIQLARAFGDKTESVAGIEFGDVPTENDSFTQIAKSVKTGFLKGYSQDTFRPKQEIPRYQVLVALASGFTLQPPSEPAKTIEVFQDKDKLPQWAINQVAAAMEKGLVVSYPQTNVLNPEQSATRAEVAAMIYQGLIETGKAEVVDSPYVVEGVGNGE